MYLFSTRQITVLTKILNKEGWAVVQYNFVMFKSFRQLESKKCPFISLLLAIFQFKFVFFLTSPDKSQLSLTFQSCVDHINLLQLAAIKSVYLEDYCLHQIGWRDKALFPIFENGH